MGEVGGRAGSELPSHSEYSLHVSSALLGLLNSFVVSLCQYLAQIQQLPGETRGLRGQI